MIDQRREAAIAWALMAPALIVLGVFGIFPIGYAFVVSLHQWRIKCEALIGFKHYARALGDPLSLTIFVVGIAGVGTSMALRRRRGHAAAVGMLGLVTCVVGLVGMIQSGDPRLFNAFKVTLFYAVGTIPSEVGGALLLAYLLFRIMTARGLLRVLYFLPYITPMIATAVVFRTIFSPNPGSIANSVWTYLGFEQQRWLYESQSVAGLLLRGLGVSVHPEWIDALFPSLALTCVIFYNIWVYIGYDTVILLAGLSAIPRQYFESAAIDGASGWQVFRHVALPLLSPSLFFISLVAVIGTFKAFNHIYIMRTAGAQDSVDVVSVLIFDQIYQYHNAGYASALALVLFLAILGLTVLQNRLLGRRVFYGD
ncbi:MAG: sugar ABC transporter permease [Candidatus Latescibacterota bacterium]|nr:sugar ABC transporter permease [Candidatus Latescibacterota bacterium]